MTATIPIELPWPPKELTPNARCHWRKTHKAKQAYKDSCLISLLEQGVAKLKPGYSRIPLRITICPPDARRRDRDNMQSSLKYALDSLAKRWGVDDYIFDPSYTFGDPVKGGKVVIVIGDRA